MVLEKSRSIPVLSLRVCVACKKGESLPTFHYFPMYAYVFPVVFFHHVVQPESFMCLPSSPYIPDALHVSFFYGHLDNIWCTAFYLLIALVVWMFRCLTLPSLQELAWWNKLRGLLHFRVKKEISREVLHEHRILCVREAKFDILILMFMGPCIILIVEWRENQLDATYFIILFNVHSMLNMFRPLIRPSSGACD